MTSNILKYHASSGPKKWILWAVITLTAFIVVVALYMRIFKRESALKKLRIEAELADQKAEQLRFATVREKNSVKLADMVRQAVALQKTAEAKRAEIALNKHVLDAEYKQVRALESWKDLDAYNQKSRS